MKEKMNNMKDAMLKPPSGHHTKNAFLWRKKKRFKQEFNIYLVEWQRRFLVFPDSLGIQETIELLVV